MDFFPWVPKRTNGSPASIKVPFLASIAYDPRTLIFAQFPEQHGFVRNDGSYKPNESTAELGRSVADLVQSWLFFGLFAEFVGEAVAFDDWTDESQRYIDCSKLNEILRRWQSGLVWGPRFWLLGARRDRERHVIHCLSHAISQIEGFDCLSSNPLHAGLAEIILSVKLLIQCLLYVADINFLLRWYKGSPGPWYQGNVHPKLLALLGRKPRVPLPQGCDQPSLSANLLIESMERVGWCSHVARRACKSYLYGTVNYLTQLRPHEAENIDHGPCRVAEKCIAHNSGLGQAYKTHHVVEGCTCDFVPVSTQEVINLINRDEIPLVSISEDPEEADLRLVAATPWTVFTAVSHVWADGLGNSSHNALPSCQVRRISEILRSRPQRPKVAMEGSTREEKEGSLFEKPKKRLLFWMDTYCIPVGEENDQIVKAAKAKAINHMAPIYAGAFDELVFDSGLENLHISAHDVSMIDLITAYPGTSVALAEPVTSRMEVAARILCSAWMGRSWTYQEGSLGRSCFFQLQKCSYRPILNEGLYWRMASLFHWKLVPPMLQLAHDFAEALPRAVLESLDQDRKYSTDMLLTVQARNSAARVEQFVAAWNGLLERATTQPEDQYVIFANLMDFNSYHVQKLDVSRRIPTLVLSCEELPLSLLFNSSSRTDATDQNYPTWVPAEISGDSRLVLSGSLIRKEEGMLIEKGRSLNTISIYRITLSRDHLGSFRFRTPENGTYYIESLPSNVNNNLDHDVLAPDAADYVVILDSSTGTSSDNCFLARGARLRISSHQAKQIMVNFQCPIIARTDRQFRRASPGADRTQLPLADAEAVSSECQIFIEHGPNPQPHPRNLTRRPLFAEDSLLARIIPGGVFLATFALIAVFIKKISDHLHGHTRTVWIWVLSTLLPIGILTAEVMVFTVWKKAHRAAYLETFEESWTPERGINWSRHCWRALRHLLEDW